MSQTQQRERGESLKTEALRLLDEDSYRIWFRRKYNLPPTDERYLNMTDAGIQLEFNIELEVQKRDAEYRRSQIPHCDECGYEGPPFTPNTANCPECGAEMTMPERPGSNQTTYSDDDFNQTVFDEFGIDLSKEHPKPI